MVDCMCGILWGGNHCSVYIAPPGLDGVVPPDPGLKPRANDTLPLRGIGCMMCAALIPGGPAENPKIRYY
jgi:hypothetical protein